MNSGQAATSALLMREYTLRTELEARVNGDGAVHEIADLLIVTHLDWVRNIARKLIITMNLSADYMEDFISAGYLGLVDAAKRFKGESEEEFRSFAYLRVRGAIIDSLRKNSALSAQAYRFSKALRAIDEIRQCDKGRQGPESGNAGNAVNKILDCIGSGAVAFRLSFTDVETFLPSDSDGTHPENFVSKREQYSIMQRELKTLQHDERAVLKLYYFEDKSFPSIARELGHTKSWVSKVHRKALRKLQWRCSELREAF